jgi:hypothetical protein
MNTVNIYSPEGASPYTSRVEYCNVETHIAANDGLAYEAQLLREFAAADDVPAVLDFVWKRDSIGQDERGLFYRYVR